MSGKSYSWVGRAHRKNPEDIGSINTYKHTLNLNIKKDLTKMNTKLYVVETHV
jgi:hypothetical protein